MTMQKPSPSPDDHHAKNLGPVILPLRTRFAPSPNGHLHLGHAYNALVAWRAAGGRPDLFCLRIDDLDVTRCKPVYTEQMIADLDWLGLSWSAPPLIQSQRSPRYLAALNSLQDQGFVYPCYLSRKEVQELLSAPHLDPLNTLVIAPSTRHLLTEKNRQERADRGLTPVWRLDAQKAITATGPLYWRDHKGGHHHVTPDHFGDVVIARRDIPASYHLSVVIDDADSDIALIVRGADLAPSTQIHRLLQALLDLPAPAYLHHQLIRDENKKRLAKRHGAISLKQLRLDGASRQEIIARLPEFPI